MSEADIPKREASLTQKDVIKQIVSSIAIEGLGLRPLLTVQGVSP